MTSYPDREHSPYGEPGHRAPYRGPDPQYQAPQQPKKKSKLPWILGGLAALILLLCVGGIAVVAAGGKAVNDAVTEIDANASGANAKDAQVNKAARDGKFEFTVTGIKCGVKSVGPKEFGTKAQGQFCLVDVTVKNIGKEAQIFDGSSQYAYDADGTEFSHSGDAAVYANEGNATFLEQINPGNQSKGKLVFDVPADAKITSVVLHDSPFSGGVRVKFS
jgi:hypothetical protein